MSAPIYNPVIPCVHTVPGGMFPGRMIRVQGSIPPGAQRFAINLQCGPNTDPRDDIALHLNFRFVEMCVVRNHLTAMNWGVEDTAGGMPLVRGEAFEALILCDQQSMKIALNGGHFCEFPHRVPYQRISHLTVDGDVMVQFIGFEGAQAPPQQQMYMSEPPAYGSYGAPPPAYGAPAYGAPQGYGGGQRSPKPTSVEEPNTQEKPTNPDHPSPSGIQIEQSVTIPEDTERLLDTTFTPSLAARLERLLEESLQLEVEDDSTSMSSTFTAGTTQTDQSYEEAPQRPSSPSCPIPESYSYFTLATESIYFTPINPNPNQHQASLESDNEIDNDQYETETYPTEELDLNQDDISIGDKQASSHIREDAKIVQNDQKLAICKGLLDLSYVGHDNQQSRSGQQVSENHQESETATMPADNDLVYNAAGQPPPYVKAAIDGAQTELALLDRQGLAQPIFGQPYSNIPSPRDNQSDVIRIVQPESSNIDNQADSDKQGEQLPIVGEPGIDLANEVSKIRLTGKNQLEQFGQHGRTDLSAILPKISDNSTESQIKINPDDIREQKEQGKSLPEVDDTGGRSLNEVSPKLSRQHTSISQPDATYGKTVSNVELETNAIVENIPQLGQPSQAILKEDDISKDSSDQQPVVARDGNDVQLEVEPLDESTTNIQPPPVAASLAGPYETNREKQLPSEVDSKLEVRENQSSSQIKQRDSKVTFNNGSVLVTKTSRQSSDLNHPASPAITNGKSVPKVDDKGGSPLNDDTKAVSPNICQQQSSMSQPDATNGETFAKDDEAICKAIVVRIPQPHSLNQLNDRTIEKLDSIGLVERSSQEPERIRRWARLKRFIIDRWLKLRLRGKI